MKTPEEETDIAPTIAVVPEDQGSAGVAAPVPDPPCEPTEESLFGSQPAEQAEGVEVKEGLVQDGQGEGGGEWFPGEPSASQPDPDGDNSDQVPVDSDQGLAPGDMPMEPLVIEDSQPPGGEAETETKVPAPSTPDSVALDCARPLRKAVHIQEVLDLLDSPEVQPPKCAMTGIMLFQW